MPRAPDSIPGSWFHQGNKVTTETREEARDTDRGGTQVTTGAEAGRKPRRLAERPALCAPVRTRAGLQAGVARARYRSLAADLSEVVTRERQRLRDSRGHTHRRKEAETVRRALQEARGPALPVVPSPGCTATSMPRRSRAAALSQAAADRGHLAPPPTLTGAHA
ncbi:hypothetical protein MC885_020033 [Smutsia gigantea]|nr:hypothetical protein MC885_020033 [Smutsia gigantea]